jgi:hypothetical protein
VRADLGVLNPTMPENQVGLLIAVFLVGLAIVGELVTDWGVVGLAGINHFAIGLG